MSVLERLRSLLGSRSREIPGEDDVQMDTATARTRATGGTGPEGGDAATTTGTGPSQEFVGRISGDDVGGGQESGAEARAEADRKNDSA